jgi:hypothetical protein
MIQARKIDLGGGTRTIWSAEDITELRRIEHEVRELNVELEDRVQKRTEELRKANNCRPPSSTCNSPRASWCARKSSLRWVPWSPAWPTN